MAFTALTKSRRELMAQARRLLLRCSRQLRRAQAAEKLSAGADPVNMFAEELPPTINVVTGMSPPLVSSSLLGSQF
jgi:hypothetical protein